MMEFRKYLLVCLILCLAVIPSVAIAARPSGAINLPKTKLKKVGNFYCGNVKSDWLPGRIVNRFFYSHKAERSNLAGQLRKSTKRKQKQLKAQIIAIEALITSRTPLCKQGGSASPGTGSARVKFNFSGATGLALADSVDASATFKFSLAPVKSSATVGKSNLRKTLADGALADVLETGEAKISKFLVGPNDKLYVLFDTSCRAGVSCPDRCLLGEVDIQSGEMTCVDNELSSISWPYNANNTIPSVKPLQFDLDGNLYYQGTANGMVVLRKYNSQTKKIEDLINENINLSGYLVLADGSILLAGRTATSNLYWLKKRRVGGSIVPVASFNVSWMSIFPDGRVYIGSSDATIYRMDQDAETLEPQAWLSQYGPSFNIVAGMQSELALMHSSAGSVYGVYGSPPNLDLYRLFPVPHRITTSVGAISGIQPVLSNLIIYGTDRSGYGQLILYNMTDGQEQNLIGNAQMEIYRVEYLLRQNAIQFDGQRFSDGKYVLCTVYLDSLGMACSPTGSVKLADFQSISTPGARIPPPAVSPTPIPLLEYNFTGAKALIGRAKIDQDGNSSPATLYAEGRYLPAFTADNENNIWIQDAYLTDQDTVKCALARIDRARSRPICVHSASDSVGVILSRTDGGTFFTTSTLSGGTSVYKLHFYSPASGATEIARWSALPPAGAIITSSGSLLLSTNSGSNGGWLKNFASDGQSVDLGFQGGLFSRLPDGRILVFDRNAGLTDGIRTVSSDGSALSALRYADYWASYERRTGEIECSGYNECSGAFVRAALRVGTNLFAFSRTGWGGGFYDGESALIRYAPGPVDKINLSIKVDLTRSVAIAGSDTIYLTGTLNNSPKLIAYNVNTQSEQDLTDDPEFTIGDMALIDGKLFLNGSKPNKDYAGYCDGFIGIKTLGGGTILSKYPWAISCQGVDYPIIPF